MKTIAVSNPVHSPASKTKFLSRTLPALATAFLAAGSSQAQTLSWATSYSGIQASALEETEGVVADSSGNVFATGLSGSRTAGSVIRTMKLDSRGSILWNVTHSQASLCGGMWGRTPLAQDADGNLIVVGAEFTSSMDNWNPVLLKLSAANGATLNRWAFDLGPFASLDAVAVDASGIYLLGHNNPNNGNPHVVHTLKLAADGTVLWHDSFAPSVFWGTLGGIAVTGDRVFTAAGGRVTARDLAGNVAWLKDMTLPGGGSPLAADAGGNFYLVGQNGVAKFDAAGNQLGSITGITGSISALDVDTAGNIYLAGSTVGSRASDILTQKFNPAGSLVWSMTYGKSGTYSDNGLAVTVRAGYVYVGGSKYNKNLDMCTLKYTAGQ